MSGSPEHPNGIEDQMVATTTPIGSPRLTLQDPSNTDREIYNIPPSILKRLTPVSPQKKRQCHRDRDMKQKLLAERKQKLKDYSMRIAKINENQKWKAERKRRYSNETLQKRLDSAYERRVQSYSAKSKRASESFKVIKSDDSLSKAVMKTKSVLLQCEVGILNGGCTFAIENDLISKTVCKYVVKKKIAELLSSELFDVVISGPSSQSGLISLLTSQDLDDSIAFIFRALQMPIHNGNTSRLFLQSFQYVMEEYNSSDGIMNALVTTLPKIQEREPFKSIFDNYLNANLIAILVKISRQLIVAFKFFIKSNLNKFNHQYLVFQKIWKKFNDLNSIFMKFHSLRCILNLNYSIEILLRSQRMLKLRLKDPAFVTLRQDLINDIRKYDLEVRKLNAQLLVFKKDIKMPSLNDLYFIARVLKKNKTVFDGRDMFPTFLKSMNNWRMVLIHEEYNNNLKLNKDTCHVLDDGTKESNEFYLSKYASYCHLLNLENFLETLQQKQELTEFGIRICDFLNNSLNANRLFPPLELTFFNFKDFFQKIVLHGFKDILSVDDAETYQGIFRKLQNEGDEIGIDQAKQFLIKLVRSSLVFIINSNLPKDKVLFEKYQFNRKFEYLNCPLLVEKSFEVLKRDKKIQDLIMKEILEYVRDENYQLIETLQIFKLAIRQQIPLFAKLGKFDNVVSYLTKDELSASLLGRKDEALNLKNSICKLVELNMKCYGGVYEEVRGYLRGNWR